MGRHPVSLDRPVGESEDSCFGEFIEDGGLPRPDKAAGNELLREKIEALLKTLTYREREIIRLRYGLGDGYTYTLEEVGRIFKVTRERVRQIEAKAVKKLQHPVRSQQLEGFVEKGIGCGVTSNSARTPNTSVRPADAGPPATSPRVSSPWAFSFLGNHPSCHLHPEIAFHDILDYRYFQRGHDPSSHSAPRSSPAYRPA